MYYYCVYERRSTFTARSMEICQPKLREHRSDSENQALAVEFRSQFDQLSAMTGRLAREEVREPPQPQSRD
jgi:hypothetical protein